LIVDDSAIVRKILTETISAQPDLEVVGTAPDALVARDKILALQPDVVTLDLEMPGMSGLEFLKRIVQFRPMPVVIISSLTQASCETSLEALRLGAVEVLAKPGGPYSIGELREILPQKLRHAAAAQVTKKVAVPMTRIEPALVVPGLLQDRIVAIGASTGGTEAVHQVLRGMPQNTPPIVMTQHIPKPFSTAFAARLNRVCSFEVREAEDGDELKQGLALLAPGDRHMVVRRHGLGYRVELIDGPKVCYQKPSVDVMFSSVAQAVGNRGIGVLLTGMGTDGAQGLLRMREAGARTIAQDEETCVVYGMPREAARLGAAERVLGLPGIADGIMQVASHAVRVRS
jgi:two-component system chemotaxis response regulator CheB